MLKDEGRITVHANTCIHEGDYADTLHTSLLFYSKRSVGDFAAEQCSFG